MKTLSIAVVLVGFLTVTTSFAAERVELASGDAKCVVDTQGARIVSYSVGGREQLWMPPDDSDCNPIWRHGGLPLAWPWYGRIGTGDANIHGYAWKHPFAVKARTADSVVLELKTAAATLTYGISLGKELTLRVETANTSAFDFPFAVAFHPYFRVGERDRTVVEGVGATPMAVTNAVDDGANFDAVVPRREYLIRDVARQSTLRIVAEDSTGVNVWNPGWEKDCPGVIPGDAWRRFVAVEPYARGANNFFVLRPGERSVLKMTLEVR